MLDRHARPLLDGLFDRLAGLCARLGCRPMTVTLAALVLGLCAGGAAALDLPVTAVVLLWCSGLLDAVDGALARRAGLASAWGATVDIFCDRVVELALFWAITFRHPENALPMIALLSMVLLSLTLFLTTGALAEKRGKKSFYYQAGLMERTEGFLLTSLMILFESWLRALTLLYAILVLFTVFQRFYETFHLLKED